MDRIVVLDGGRVDRAGQPRRVDGPALGPLRPVVPSGNRLEEELGERVSPPVDDDALGKCLRFARLMRRLWDYVRPHRGLVTGHRSLLLGDGQRGPARRSPT